MAKIITESLCVSYKINKKKIIINEKIVIFDKCRNILSDKHLKFINTKNVVFDECDKNFVYYWLTKKNFPKLDYILLNSHPCDPLVFKRFYNEEIKTPIFLSNNFKREFVKWGKGIETLELICQDDLEFIISKMKE